MLIKDFLEMYDTMVTPKIPVVVRNEFFPQDCDFYACCIDDFLKYIDSCPYDHYFHRTRVFRFGFDFVDCFGTVNNLCLIIYI